MLYTQNFWTKTCLVDVFFIFCRRFVRALKYSVHFLLMIQMESCCKISGIKFHYTYFSYPVLNGWGFMVSKIWGHYFIWDLQTSIIYNDGQVHSRWAVVTWSLVTNFLPSWLLFLLSSPPLPSRVLSLLHMRTQSLWGNVLSDHLWILIAWYQRKGKTVCDHHSEIKVQ